MQSEASPNRNATTQGTRALRASGALPTPDCRHGEAAGAREGFTLVELVITLALVAIITSMAVPASDRMFSNQRLSDSARKLDWAFSYAREEAIRTGNMHIVFVQTDAADNGLVDSEGKVVDVLILDDGRPGAGGQNCAVDSGEPTTGLRLEASVRFGVSAASAKVDSDGGAGSISTGSTFVDAGSNQARWVVFRPEGTPLAFSADCTTGAVGSGGGGIYLTNGRRDAALVLTPLGSSRVHSWRPDNGGWSG